MKKGFSLIEILILIFIGFSILILIFGVISNSREFARTMGCVNNIKTIAQAIENYQADWRESPGVLSSLIPIYIQNSNLFHCPSDKNKGDSYSEFYIGRYFVEEDSNKVFLLCPRHFGGRRSVVGYLSYSVEVNKNKTIKYKETEWSEEKIAKPGEVFEKGTLKFEDETIVYLNGKTGIGGSFVDTQGKIYSIIFIPEGINSNITVDHKKDSRFEVITPAVIAGVEGTKFNVISNWITSSGIPIAVTTVSTQDGKVIVKERNQGRSEEIQKNEEIYVETKTYEVPLEIINIPRKPPKVQPHIIKRVKK